VRFLADHNFDERILRQLASRRPDVSLVRVREIAEIRTPDADLLDWCASHGYVLLTHDISTVPPIAHARIAAGLRMPGVVLVPERMPIGPALDNLLILIGTGDATDLENSTVYLPL
jgi:hypothetical protein